MDKDVKEALRVLDIMASKAAGTRYDHQAVIRAIEVLRSNLDTKEEDQKSKP